jgi:double-stranded uracil-DNA glycosylase
VIQKTQRRVNLAARRVPASRRPTADELTAARAKRVPDVIAPGLNVLFVGINPGLYTAAVGHHFARPGNRFWPALHASGFTPRLLSPCDERELLAYGCGITNVVARATAEAAELTPAEIVAGGRRLVVKLKRYRPRVVAFLGVTTYRLAFAQPRAAIGPQPDVIEGVPVWVLPNPSGLNAHYQPRDFTRLFRSLRLAAAR